MGHQSFLGYTEYLVHPVTCYRFDNFLHRTHCSSFNPKPLSPPVNQDNLTIKRPDKARDNTNVDKDNTGHGKAKVSNTMRMLWGSAGWSTEISGPVSSQTCQGIMQSATEDPASFQSYTASYHSVLPANLATGQSNQSKKTASNTIMADLHSKTSHCLLRKKGGLKYLIYSILIIRKNIKKTSVDSLFNGKFVVLSDQGMIS